MNHLLDIAICNSLHFKIEENIAYILNSIPNNTFGVFVTVHRDELSNDVNYKDNVHGCIGNWTNNLNTINTNISRFDIMTKDNIIKSIKEVSYKATWEDNRKNYFDTIYKDAYSDYEITFMLNDLHEINNNGFITSLNINYSNNSNYGIIVTDINNKRATYLPKIFKEEKDWNYIRNSLLQKAGITSNSYQFFAYNTEIHSKKIYEIFSANFFNNIKFNFINFINKYYTTDIPYIVTEDKEIKYDKSQDVRNLSLLNDIYEFKDYINPEIIELCNLEINKYKSKFIRDKTKLRQASSFLVQILVKSMDSSDINFSKQICSYLYYSIDFLEKKFERGEVLIAIALSCPNHNYHTLTLQQDKMYKEMISKDYNINDIFQYNWECKFLYVLYQNSIQTDNYISNHGEILASRMINILDILYKNNETETNYYAVGFEGLSSILLIVKELNIKKSILDNILYIYKILMDRYDVEYGLFKFNNGSSRIDITGHIINGILALNYNINYIINDN
tara:strand:- start:1181 stop:2698 length:1518 start_codon:yes stop_codon:yes gene_type:complete